MRILMLHNYYQRRGGEDESAEQEVTLLKAKGHDILFYVKHNEEIRSYSPLQKALLLARPTWSASTYRDVESLIRESRPDIVHVQNFFPLISPSIYYACQESGIPVVQTLHNYRLLCPNGLFLRRGTICEECLTHSLLRSIRYGCYRQSRAQTAAVALMLQTHRWLKTWRTKVDVFITLTHFARQKLIQGGLPASRIVVRSNFLLEDPGMGRHRGDYAIFVGRLSVEKGLTVLLEAWRQLPRYPLKIIGDGPLRKVLEQYACENHLDQVEFLGFRPLKEVTDYLKEARVLIMPSIWYETFGRIVMEAYAVGTPVIVSHLGAMAELVQDSKTGFLFEPRSADDLAEKVRYSFEHPQGIQRLGEQARQEFKAKYTGEVAYRRLMHIYEQA